MTQPDPREVTALCERIETHGSIEYEEGNYGVVFSDERFWNAEYFKEKWVYCEEMQDCFALSIAKEYYLNKIMADERYRGHEAPSR